jgi:hypothetical protein
MKIQLSEHFTYKKLLRFVLPSIIMMIFTSIYGIVDGLFVSNYVGKTAFAAVNLVMPLMMGVSALGFMVGTGGSAIVAKTLGEGEHKKANEYFSLLVYVAFIGGVIFSLCGMLLVRPVASLLGAEGALQDNVRNNREYDVLTKEIEFQSLEIELCEKRIKEYIAAEKAKSEEIEHIILLSFIFFNRSLSCLDFNFLSCNV